MELTGRTYPWQETLVEKILHIYRAGKLAHAYLLSGAEYQGKLEFALSFATFLLCESPEGNKPCLQCGSCLLVKAASHSDLRLVMPEKLMPGELKQNESNKKETNKKETNKKESKQIRIEQIRELADWSSQTAQRGGYKIAILCPAETMNRSTANALLKCLEEPPERTLLLLVSHQPNRLLPTIKSRCQRFEFKTPDRESGLKWLMAELDDKEAVEPLLALARGSPLKVTRVFDPVYLSQRDQLIRSLIRLVEKPDEVFQLAVDLEGFEITEILLLWQDFLYDCVRYACGKEIEHINSRDLTKEIQIVAREIPIETLFRFIDLLYIEYKKLTGGGNLNSRLSLESLLINWSDSSYASSGQD